MMYTDVSKPTSSTPELTPHPLLPQDALKLSWDARFTDAELESAYLKSQNAALYTLFIAALSIFQLLWISNLCIDYWYKIGGMTSSVLLALRLFCVILTAVCLLITLRQGRTAPIGRLIEIFSVVLLIAGQIFIALQASPRFIDPVSQIGAIFALQVLTPIPLKRLIF